MWLVVTDFLGSESFVLASVLVGQGMLFLCTSNMTDVFPFCSLLNLYVMEKCYTLKVRTLKMGYSLYFRLSAAFLTCSKSDRIQRLT